MTNRLRTRATFFKVARKCGNHFVAGVGLASLTACASERMPAWVSLRMVDFSSKRAVPVGPFVRGESDAMLFRGNAL